MATRRALQGLLNSFLGTYVSRYSDHEGYLVFGQLAEGPGRLETNLLAALPAGPCDSAEQAAVRIARIRFREQTGKHDIDPSWIREASLTIERVGPLREGEVCGDTRPGFDVTFRASATTDLGRVYVADAAAFVAVHDPESELRRHPDDRGA
jgi:hypothetical protein